MNVWLGECRRHGLVVEYLYYMIYIYVSFIQSAVRLPQHLRGQFLLIHWLNL